jgi:hypothetical protein
MYEKCIFHIHILQHRKGSVMKSTVLMYNVLYYYDVLLSYVCNGQTSRI